MASATGSATAPITAPAADAFAPETGRPVTVAPGLVRITAPNRGPHTGAGTNSYLLGTESVVVVDPGPASGPHLEALLAAIGERRVAAILLTHTHHDHAALAGRLQRRTGAPAWFGASPPDPERRLTDGQRLRLAGMEIAVIATRGHSADHLCFGIAGTPFLLSGDHVMGWSSTVLSPAAGALAEYLVALRRLAALPYRCYLPGHGGPIADGPARARALLAHRETRNAQILGAVGDGARTLGQLRRRLYPRLAAPLIPAAQATLQAHIAYLEAAGALRWRRGWLGRRIEPAG